MRARSSGQLARAIPVLGLALLAVAATALALPWSGHDLETSPGQAPVLRLLLLLGSHAVVGLAAYRRSGDAVASGIAVLLGAALGWSGWEWSALSPGWLPFAALVLLLSWPGERPASLAAGLAIAWAVLDPGAIWGALLLIASAAGGTVAESRRRLLLAGGGLLAAVLLLVRGIDLRALALPVARPWVWADHQAQNTPADPIGLALFALLLALLGLRLLRPKRIAGGLAALALLGFLAWHARRNGIWLGLAATPVVAEALGGAWKETLLPGRLARPAVLAAATCIGGGLLLAASLIGPRVIGGTPIPAGALESLPGSELLVYRPEFEPALLRVRDRSTLALAGQAGTSNYASWERIAANCDPAAELERLKAGAVMLDREEDAAVIATLRSAGWRTAWTGPAVVLAQPGTGA